MHTFDTAMPFSPQPQHHAHPKQSDNFGFLAPLTGDHLADVNLWWFWRDHNKKTRASGGAAVGAHYGDPHRNGYDHWVVKRGKRLRVEPIPKARLHSVVWNLNEVLRWRRGPHLNSPRPHTYAELCTYVKHHGGTIIGELKARAFADYGWIMGQLVATARRIGHAPWFKALTNMWQVGKKAINTVKAGGWFAYIFGDHIHGRSHRLAAGRPLVAKLPPDVQLRVRIW